jgi:hypothetical protein
MGRIRPMAVVPRAWRHASGARGGLSGSWPTAEVARPASVRPAAETARWLALADAACNECVVSARAAHAGRRSVHRVRGVAASDGSPGDGAWQGRRRKHPRSTAKASGNRKRGGAHPSGCST